MPAASDTTPRNDLTDAPPPRATPPDLTRGVPPDVTPPPPPPAPPVPPARGGRSGAVWVAGTGAFLLVAAAALFVAVNWSAIPLSLKIGIIGGFTGAVLYAGAAMKERTPGVAGVLSHLGAFLLPIDIGALTYKLGWAWDTRLLAEGLVGLIAFPLLARATGSTVLRWATGVAAIATASALGAMTPVPAPVILVIVAAIGVALHDRELQRAGATLAGVAGVGGALASALAPALQTTTLQATGWVIDSASVALATGLLAGVALLLHARRVEDTRVALVGAIVALVGIGHAAVLTELTPTMEILAAPVAFVAIEAIVLLVSRDRFYAAPAAVLGALVEMPAILASFAAAAYAVVATPFLTTGFLGSSIPPQVVEGVALALLGAGWLLAWGRRALVDETTAGATSFVSAPAVAGVGSLVAAAWAFLGAVVVGTAEPGLIALATLSLIGAGLGRRSLRVRASVSLATLVVCGTAIDQPLYALIFAIPVTAAVLAVTLRASLGAADAASRGIAALIALPAVGALVGGVAIASEDFPMALLVAVLAAAGWVIAVALDDRDDVSADAVRLVAGLTTLSLLVEPTLAGVAVAAGIALVANLDSVRTRARITWAAVGPVLVGVGVLADVAGLGEVGAAYAFALTAVVTGGLSLLLDQERRVAAIATSAAALTIATVFAASEPEALTTLLLVVGVATAATGVALRRVTIIQVGLGVATLGAWMRLGLSDIQASELYTLPIALMLVVAGIDLRRRGPSSSWMTFAPAVAIVGLPALVERTAGGAGSGWHAVGGGLVAVLAVGLGGYYRQAGPLFIGTALLLAFVGYEAFAVIAGVPTWAWLALGGGFLVAVGVMMERAETSPAEASRRLVEVIGERFE